MKLCQTDHRDHFPCCVPSRFPSPDLSDRRGWGRALVQSGPRTGLPLVIALALSVLLASSGHALVFVVNSLGNAPDEVGSVGDGQCSTGADITLDDGQLEPECTLLAAIEEANAWPGRDQIHFSNPVIFDDVTGVAALEQTLFEADITDPVDIDGRTAPTYVEGESPKILVQSVDPSLGTAFAFEAGSEDSTIRAIAIQNYTFGVAFSGTDGAWIDGCDLGYFAPITPLQGTVDGNGIGIYVGAGAIDTHIGKKIENGEFQGIGNVISGNEEGIWAAGDTISIVGNKIGTNRSGAQTQTLIGTPLGNEIGVLSRRASNVRIGRSILVPVGGGTPVILEYRGSLGNVISGNVQDGILIVGGGRPGDLFSVSVQANTIGTDLAGNVALPNGGDGISIFGGSAPILIGSPLADPNIISGNGGSGISNNSFGDVTMEIVRNHIGVDEAGVLPLSNGAYGIHMNDAGDLLIESNVVGGNVEGGIKIGDPLNPSLIALHDIHIEDNWIGSNPTGDKFGNGGPGIHIDPPDLSPGFLTIEGNYVGDNASGIELRNLEATTTVVGNFVGTNDVGVDLGNRGEGILAEKLSRIVLIGSTLSGGNVVGWNSGHGIAIAPSTIATGIYSNDIGVSPNGSPAPNALDGIHVLLDAAAPLDSRVTIGASLLEPDVFVQNPSNRIAFNLRNGISLEPDALATMRGNEFKGNGLLAIDLDEDGASPNDPADADAGANWLQNFPDLDESNSSVNWQTGNLDLRFLVDSDPSSSDFPLKVDFYLADASGTQAEQFLGSSDYEAADAQAWRDVTIDPQIPFPANVHQVVAIATDASGNTSEVGPPIEVPEPNFVSALLLSAGVLARGVGCRRRSCDGRRAPRPPQRDV